MARQGISKEQVYEVAAALRDEGIAPTVQIIRERLGTGSFSTISSGLSAWKVENANRISVNIPSMPDKVQVAFQQAWASATRRAQQDVEAERQALEAMRKEIDKDRAEMAAEINRLETELEETRNREGTMRTALEQARQECETAEHQFTKLRIENARLDERSKASDIRAGELKIQVGALQERFAEVAKQTEPKPAQENASAAKLKSV
jgi:chromosome segregation ATPase